jgi:hypothetical protein
VRLSRCSTCSDAALISVCSMNSSSMQMMCGSDTDAVCTYRINHRYVRAYVAVATVSHTSSVTYLRNAASTSQTLRRILSTTLVFTTTCNCIQVLLLVSYKTQYSTVQNIMSGTCTVQYSTVARMMELQSKKLDKTDVNEYFDISCLYTLYFLSKNFL